MDLHTNESLEEGNVQFAPHLVYLRGCTIHNVENWSPLIPCTLDGPEIEVVCQHGQGAPYWCLSFHPLTEKRQLSETHGGSYLNKRDVCWAVGDI